MKAIGLLEALNSRIIAQLSVFRLEKKHGYQERMVRMRSITIPRILKRWSNPHDLLDIKDGNTPEVRKIKCWVARNSRYYTKHEQACVGGKAIEWSMIIQFI